MLGLIIAEHLFRAYPGHGEGELTAHAFAASSGAKSCAAAGDTIGLSELVIIGTGERAKGMNLNRTLLGDVMEALIAAIYLDGGFEAARAFVLKAWADAPRPPVGGGEGRQDLPAGMGAGPGAAHSRLYDR